MFLSTIIGVTLALVTTAEAKSKYNEYLVKMNPQVKLSKAFRSIQSQAEIEEIGFNNWVKVKPKARFAQSISTSTLNKLPGVEYAQPNYKIKIFDNPQLLALREKIAESRAQGLSNVEFQEILGTARAMDNPAIPTPSQPSSGSDSLLNNQWGVLDIGSRRAWDIEKGKRSVVVAVIDTGVDYTHEDLKENLWRNFGENGVDAQGKDKSTNGIDDDKNGYVDDSIGWDFVSNDNKPFDLSKSSFELLTGGNPGHGTHCAGNVAARGLNGKGVSGVAPSVSIMSLRFLSEDGQGTTDGAVKAIQYALANGARITSNSWGSEGEDPGDPGNKALREIIAESERKGVLFIAAAGNGHQGNGYDNDSDPKPGYPASYSDDIIISVAALDSNNNLGSFSNWGLKSVDIGAPGVKVFSTMVGNKYSDKVLDLGFMQVYWDGTSMATPHVAGAAALYLSRNPNASWKEIKTQLLDSAVPVPSLQGKLVTGGKLNLDKLIK